MTENINNLVIRKWDMPCMRFIIEILPDGNVMYVNKILREQYPTIQLGKGYSSIKDYGFIYDGNKFIKKNNSTVKWVDGRDHNWQGANEFTYNDIINSSEYRDYKLER